jgi:AP-4 complex subunit epsilon-1
MNNAAISDFDYEERMRRALQDKESSVVGAALNLYHEEMKKGNIAKYKPLASNFVALLKQIIEHKLHKV